MDSPATASPNRLKTFLLGGVSGVLGRVVAILLGLVSVPVGLHHFGVAPYGMWLVISSTLAYLAMSQLGIGSAAAIFVAQSTDSAKQRTLLWRATGMLSIVAAVAAAVFGAVVALFPGWVGILGHPSADLLAIGAKAFIVSALFYFLGIPLSSLASAFAGLQLIYLARLYEMANQIAAFGALLLTVGLGGDLVMLAIATGSASLLVSLVAAAHLFLRRPDLWAHGPQDPTVASPRTILATGVRCFLIGIASMIVWSTDNLVVNYFLGPAAVTAYATTFRLLANGYALFMLVNGVVGPMYGHAFGRGDWEWIARTHRSICRLLPALAGLLWLGAVVFARDVIRLWAGPEAYGGMGLVMALGLYGYALSLVNSHTALLVNLKVTKRLVGFSLAEAGVNLALSLMLVHLLKGAGVALATALASLSTVFWLLPRQLASHTDRNVTFSFGPVALHALLVLAPAIVLVLLVGPGWAWWAALLKVGILIAYCWASWSLMPLDLRRTITELLFARLAARLRTRRTVPMEP